MVIDSAPKAIGIVYAVVLVFALAYLFRTGRYNRRATYALLAVSSLLGFLIFAPMLPNQIQVLLLGNTKQLGASVPMAVLGLGVFVVLTFVFGRLFCSHACPIGALQELVYRLRTRKLRITNKWATIGLRLAFFAGIAVGAVVFSEGLLARLGLKQFFHLDTASVYFYGFAAIALVSVLVYRPFCRFACPYAVVLSPVSSKSVHGLRRTEKCTDCRKCERVCPTGEAGEFDRKQECYLCNRCREVCPVGAIEYGRQGIARTEEDRLRAAARKSAKKKSRVSAQPSESPG